MIQLSIEDIPSSVKALPSLAQHMWLRVYNRGIKLNPHPKASEGAWSVIRQFYKKGKKGKWFKIN